MIWFLLDKKRTQGKKKSTSLGTISLFNFHVITDRKFKGTAPE
jgi:hypothetical protein